MFFRACRFSSKRLNSFYTFSPPRLGLKFGLGLWLDLGLGGFSLGAIVRKPFNGPYLILSN